MLFDILASSWLQLPSAETFYEPRRNAFDRLSTKISGKSYGQGTKNSILVLVRVAELHTGIYCARTVMLEYFLFIGGV